MIKKAGIKLIKENDAYYGIDPGDVENGDFEADPIVYLDENATQAQLDAAYTAIESQFITLDLKQYDITLNNNEIEEKTLRDQDIAQSAPGVFTADGSLTMPLRMSQWHMINEMGFGFSEKLDIRQMDEGTVYTMAEQYVSMPVTSYVPSYTMYKMTPEGQGELDIGLGSVFSNYKLDFNLNGFVDVSFNINSQNFRTIPEANITKYITNKAKDIPLNKADYVRSLDLTLYSDVQLEDYLPSVDPVTGAVTSGYDVGALGDRQIIDVIYDGTLVDVDGDEVTTTEDLVSTPKYVITGKRLTKIKRLSLTMGTNLYTDDAHYLGSRLMDGDYARKVKDFNNELNFELNYVYDKNGYNEMYNMSVNGAKQDNVIEPTSCGIGRFSIVAKAGSMTDIGLKDGGLHKNTAAPSDFLSTDIDNPLSPQGSPNRGIFIIPNVQLKAPAKSDAPGSIRTMNMTGKLLPDYDNVFANKTIGSSALDNQKIVSIIYQKLATPVI